MNEFNFIWFQNNNVKKVLHFFNVNIFELHWFLIFGVWWKYSLGMCFYSLFLFNFQWSSLINIYIFHFSSPCIQFIIIFSSFDVFSLSLFKSQLKLKLIYVWNLGFSLIRCTIRKIDDRMCVSTANINIIADLKRRWFFVWSIVWSVSWITYLFVSLLYVCICVRFLSSSSFYLI